MGIKAELSFTTHIHLGPVYLRTVGAGRLVGGEVLVPGESEHLKASESTQESMDGQESFPGLPMSKVRSTVGRMTRGWHVILQVIIPTTMYYEYCCFLLSEMRKQRLREVKLSG